MKLQLLFDELKKITENTDNVFAESGMVNCFNQMKFGFFPVGFGVLTEDITLNFKASEVEIGEGGIMVLGHDFGTVDYVSEVKKSNKGFGETKSTTIINMLKFIKGLEIDKAFFTNIYLGVRLDDGEYTGTTMTKRFYNDRPFKVKKEYSDLCIKYFIRQLELIKPKKVICLGHEVKNALMCVETSFHQWKPKSDSLEKLYKKRENNHIVKSLKLNGIEFIVIPHPCYLVNLLKPPYLTMLNEFLSNN